MIYNVLMISEQTLKNNTPINENVDTSELRFSIQMSQNIFVLESLGQNLYNKMLELIETGDIDLSGYTHYKTLLKQYITPMLTQYAYYTALDNFFIKFVNIGLQQMRSEQGNPITIKELSYLKNNARDNAQFLDNLMRRYLVFNTWMFPEYSQVKDPADLLPEFGGAFKSSVILPVGRYIGGRTGYGYGNGILAGSCPYPSWYGGRGSGE